ncbi:MAG TPA: FHA domain-containing protein [Planctomycetota bacterium]
MTAGLRRGVRVSGYLSLSDGRTLPVSNGVVVGRVAGCDLVINDAKASRRHARFVVESGVVEIEDLGSSNGTLLNNKPVTRRMLRDGDQVQIGKTIITFREGVMPVGSGAVSKPVVDEDNDLFGSDSATATSLVAPSAPSSRTAPPPVPPPPAPSMSRPAAVAPTSPRPSSPPAAPVPTPVRTQAPPPAPPPRPAVVEFADEVVEIRRADKPAPSKPAIVSAGAPVVASPSRVLQFQKQKGGTGLLRDDLSQLSGGARSLIFAVVLVLAAALAWGVMVLVR